MRKQAQEQVGRVDDEARATHRVMTQPGFFMVGLGSGAGLGPYQKNSKRRKGQATRFGVDVSHGIVLPTYNFPNYDSSLMMTTT